MPSWAAVCTTTRTTIPLPFDITTVEVGATTTRISFPCPQCDAQHGFVLDNTDTNVGPFVAKLLAHGAITPQPPPWTPNEIVDLYLALRDWNGIVPPELFA